MKHLRVCALGLRAGSFELDPEASHYVSRVHRLAQGSSLELFDPDQRTKATATLVRSPTKSGGALVQVVLVTEADDPSLPLTLAACLGKGDKPEQALRDATVLGARKVVLLGSERVQVRHSGREAERYRKVMLDTARQCGRASLPEVLGPVELEAWLHGIHGRRVVFSLAPGAKPLLDVLARWQPGEELTLAVGPEGGLAPGELALFRETGFEFATLGPWVLRAETAVTVVLGVARAVALGWTV
jgi:16S rRNA (uracil1498-N3)-methyltransferase